MPVFNWFEDMAESWVEAAGEGITNLIEEFLRDFLTGCISSIFTSVSNLLNTFSSDFGDGGLLNIFTGDITTFIGNNTDGSAASPIWNFVKTLSNNVIVPIAGYILVIVLCCDFISMAVSGNNFKEFDEKVIFQWIIKAFCGILLISNVFYIATGVFSVGTTVCYGAINNLFGGGELFGGDLAFFSLSESLKDEELFTLVLLLLMGVLLWLMTIIMYVVMIIVLASRVIEAFMYLSISPIPMATMIGQGEPGTIGKSWLKNLLAISFQGFFVILALGIYANLFYNTAQTLAASAGNDDDGVIILDMVMLLGYSAALIFTMLRSGQISKSVFNAH